MTGRYQERFGYEYNNGPAKRDVEQGLGLAVGEITLGQEMKATGYHTGLIGKWHLGSQDQFYPTNRGFDEFVGFLDQLEHPKSGRILQGDAIFLKSGVPA